MARQAVGALWGVLVLLAATEVAAQRAGCCFGKTYAAHGDTVMTLDSCCVSLVCVDGDILQVKTGTPGSGECGGEPQGCEFGGQVYSNGSSLPAHCSALTCVGGAWTVTTGGVEACCEHCLLFNAAHVVTFDHTHYHWAGPCNYSVVQTGPSLYPDVAVFTSFTPCSSLPTFCLHATTFRNDPHTLITLTHVTGDDIFQIMVNGQLHTVGAAVQEVKSGPVSHPVLAWRDGACVFLLGSSGLLIQHCPYRLDVWTYPTHVDNLHGLCGHFNFNPSDDMTARDGTVHPVHPFPLAFPESWRTADQSNPLCKQPCRNCNNPTRSNECTASDAERRMYAVRCSQRLHPVLGPDTHLQHLVAACVYDLCLLRQGRASEEQQERWLKEVVKVAQNSKILIAKSSGLFVPDPLFAPVQGLCVQGSTWKPDCNQCSCVLTSSFQVCTFLACPEDFVPQLGEEYCTNGSRWKLEECNICVCINGGIICTLDECSSRSPVAPSTSAQTLAPGPTTPPILVCSLAREAGSCAGQTLRWHYDFGSATCSAFYYSGCGGNHNNFMSKEECEAICGYFSVSRSVAVCDKSRCPWPLWAHYLAKQCVPQYKGDACCPTSFHCPSASESGRDTTKCHYKGVAYSAGDSVPVQDDCSADCRCLQPSDASSPPEITCANVECPELFRPPRPGCRLLFRQGQCCAYDEECEEPGAPPLQPRAATCSWQNKTYQEGSKMSFNDQPCQSCICGPGFTNPSGPGCSKVACGLDFRYKSELHRGCAPIHFETKRCCHIDWLCPGSNNIKPQQQQQQQPGTADESSVCHLGDRRLAVGETLALTDCKIDCRCLTPPELTCIQYRSCELAQQTAAERACPPLHCEPGCRPVVGDPGPCPKCSCSPDTFSCPAQTCPTLCQPELDLQTGCPTCKCQCPAVVCPIACPSHTVLDEPTGCPRCVCKPGSPRDHEACPLYPGGVVPCPQDCAVIKRKDENGCEVCECDPNDPGNPFGRPLPRDPSSCRGEGQAPCPMDCAIIREKDRDGCEVCKCDPNDPGNPFGRPLPREPSSCHGEGQAPCPMDCAIIREKDRDGCEVCKCDPDNPGHPFGRPLPRDPSSCHGEGQAPCPMDCAIIREKDRDGCEVCKCDPDNPGHPFGRPMPRDPSSCRGEGQAPCPMDCAIIREKDRDGCEVCKCDPDNPGHPFGRPLPREPRSCHGEGQAPCPMDCAIIREKDRDGCEICKCDPDNPGHPFGPHPLPPQFRVRRSCPGKEEAPCPMDCGVIRYPDSNGCWVCKCDPDNPGNPFGPFIPPPGRHW